MTPPLKKFSNIFHEILNNQKPYSFVTCAQYLCLFNSVGAYPPILLRVNSKFTDIMYQVHCTLSAQLLLVIITELCSVCLCLSVPPWEDNRVQTIVQTRQYITRHSLLSHIDGEIFHGRAEVAENETVVCMCSLKNAAKLRRQHAGEKYRKYAKRHVCFVNEHVPCPTSI